MILVERKIPDHGWTRILSDANFASGLFLIRVYLCSSVVEIHLINSHEVSGCRLQAFPSSVSMCTSSLKLLSTRQSILSSVMPHGPPIFNFISSPGFTPL